MVRELVTGLGFAQIRVMPCGQHALGKRFNVDDASRLAMLRAALSGLPGVCLDLYEMKSSAPSYAVDSCRRHLVTANGAPLFFIVGSDVLGELHRWERWQDILLFSNLLIVRRPGQRKLTSEIDWAAMLKDLSCAQQAEEPAGGYDVSERLLHELLETEGASPEVASVLRNAGKQAAGKSLAEMDVNGVVVCAELTQWPLSSSIVRAALAIYDSAVSSEQAGPVQDWLQAALPAQVWSYIKSNKLYLT